VQCSQAGGEWGGIGGDGGGGNGGGGDGGGGDGGCGAKTQDEDCTKLSDD